MLALNLLVVLIAAASVHSEAQFFGYPPFNPYAQYAGYPQQYFRNGFLAGSQDGRVENRLFGGGLSNYRPVTLTLASVTSTITAWETTRCTTSTAALTICSPAGRRRRGLLLNNNKQGRSLFYADDDETEADSIFLPSKAEEKVAVEEPAEVRSTFAAPEQIRDGRQFVNIGTSTFTTTVTKTYTDSLTAVCASTTSFKVCG